MTTILKGHVSPETAYVVDDYPYGFRLRCVKRYWIEHHPKKGDRLMSQTTNPKANNVWNKPKASIYASVAGCMYLDDDDHVQWRGLHMFSTSDEAIAFLDVYGPGVPEASLPVLKGWVAAKIKYEAGLKAGLLGAA